ncbi:MAG: universal stress protein [Deltaproteobacteria bacterium]|nr:universal stress protein [Deltaproteobacteria bacterium]
MIQVKSILVPVDFSEGSRYALEYAIGLAQKFGASIEVLHAWYTPEYISPAVAVQAIEGESQTLEALMNREAKRQLEEFLKKMKVPEGVEIRTSFELGPEAEVISTVAKNHDMIVMGTHGRSGIARLFMGSVADGVLRRAPCPVLVIRSPRKPERGEEKA